MARDADGSTPGLAGGGPGEGHRPGYREYAVVLVVIVILGAVALAVFGGQTTQILSVTSGSI